MSEPDLVVERHGHVEVLRLNRPQRANSINASMSEALGKALNACVHDPDVRVAIITGTGDRIFCAGMDLKAFAEERTDDAPMPAGETAEGEGHKGLDVLLRGRFPKPLIAAVNGAAVGGGFEIVLSCDLVVAADTARFGLPEAARGLVPGGCGTDLPRRIPLAVALEMGMTGEPISAQRALDLGLVNRVVPPEALLDEALALAERVSKSGPLAVAAVKRLMWEAAPRTDLDYIAEVIKPVFGSQDALEGATAFAERREPEWHGR